MEPLTRDRRAGFSLIEVAVVVALIGVFAALAAIFMGDAFGDSRAKAGVRSVGDLLMLARQEAIRTGENHVVFFDRDADDNALTGLSGQPAVVLLIRDADGDGRVDAGEKVAAINAETASNSLSWGSVFAATQPTPQKAPGDNPGATFPETDPDFVCCTFLDPDGNKARWVVFLPDGMPRAFKVGPFSAGTVASGNGAVYVTSGTRDYAVVLAPLGGVRAHAWDRAAEAWTQ